MVIDSTNAFDNPWVKVTSTEKFKPEGPVASGSPASGQRVPDQDMDPLLRFLGQASEVGVGPLCDVLPVRQVVPVLPARFDDVGMTPVVGERPLEADREPASVGGNDGLRARR